MDKLTFEFDLDKAIEVTAMLIKLHGSNLSSTELLQLLYLIDRCSIRDTNYPIIGGTYVRHITIMIEEVYQSLFCHHTLSVEVQERQLKWKEYFSVNEEYVELIEDPGWLYLNEREKEQISFIYETIRYLGLGFSIFSFPEWKNLYNYSTLDVVKLLKVLEKTDEEIEEIATREKLH